MKRWRVLFGCFLGMSVATPAILMLPMGLYMKSVTAEFAWSRTDFSIIISIVALCNALILPFAGYLADRFGPPRIIAIGIVLGCASYAALTLASSYLGFILLMALAVTTGNLAAYPAYMGIAQRWFDKHLGLALAITSAGLAAGAGVFSYVIATTIEQHGWRIAFLMVGIAALIIGLINLSLFVRDNRGPVPEEERRDKIIQTEQREGTLIDALRTSEFWFYTASFTLVIFSVVGCSFHLPAMLSDRGASSAQIASIVAMGSAGSLFGRLVTGIMLDRYSVRMVAGIVFLGQAIGFMLLWDGLQWAMLAGFLLGAVQGAEIDVMGYVIARRFGRLAFSRIFGTCFAITLIGAMTGPIVMATIFDRTGSYDLGLMALPFLPVFAFALLFVATASLRKFEVVISPSA